MSRPSAYLVNALPALPIVLPLLTAALLSGTRKHLARATSDSIAITCASVHLGLCITLFLRSQSETLVYWFGNWLPRGSMALGIDFVVDPAAAGTASLASALMLLALVFSWRFVDAGANHYQPLMLIFLTGMTGFCFTGDLFNLFVF